MLETVYGPKIVFKDNGMKLRNLIFIARSLIYLYKHFNIFGVSIFLSVHGSKRNSAFFSPEKNGRLISFVGYETNDVKQCHKGKFCRGKKFLQLGYVYYDFH